MSSVNICGVIDCNEWKTEKHHEYANMGKENDTYYGGNCTARHCLSGTYEISPRWIFVRLSVHLPRKADTSAYLLSLPRDTELRANEKTMFRHATHFQKY